MIISEHRLPAAGDTTGRQQRALELASPAPMVTSIIAADRPGFFSRDVIAVSCDEELQRAYRALLAHHPIFFRDRLPGVPGRGTVRSRIPFLLFRAGPFGHEDTSFPKHRVRTKQDRHCDG
jgi:hypothetical protein